jgi:hypothetical protein
MFKFKIIINPSLHASSSSKIIYYAYIVLQYLLTFLLGSCLVANDYRLAFVLLWSLILALDIGIFIMFYNKNGNVLGSPVAFVILVREILTTLTSILLIGMFYEADYDIFSRIYGGIIWGFLSAKIIDAFPKFYIFGNKQLYMTTTTITPTIYDTIPLTTNCPIFSASNSDSVFNAINIVILSILTPIVAFFGSTMLGTFLALVYSIYVLGFIVYRNLNKIN